jgi:hypothetical protein
VGPASRWVAAGLSSWEMLLPATQADIKNAATNKLINDFMVTPLHCAAPHRNTSRLLIIVAEGIWKIGYRDAIPCRSMSYN